MAIASFAWKVFEVHTTKNYTFDEFQYGTTLETEKQDVTGKKPSTYNKRPALDTLSFSVVLDASRGVNPRFEIAEWKSIKDKAIAYPFIMGGKPFGAPKWLLVDVQVSDTVIDNKGKLLRAVLSLKFDEYVREGSAPKEDSKSKSAGVKSSANKSAYNQLSPSQKSGLKRETPQYEDMISRKL